MRKSEKTNCFSLQFALKYLRIGKINQNIQKPKAAGESLVLAEWWKDASLLSTSPLLI